MQNQKLSIISLNNSLKCAICHADIKDNSSIYQSKLNFGIICANCLKIFSLQDIELISNIFLVYGGFYGQYEKTNISIDNLFYDLLIKLGHKEGELDINEINVKLLHHLLLFGFTPEDYLNLLDKTLDL
jgi:hypothetical protein